MPSAQHIEVIAGKRPDGVPVVERLTVQSAEDGSEALVLLQSPAFVRGLAKGDKIRFEKEQNNFQLLQHSGNLAVRVFARESLAEIAEDLTEAIEKLGGQLDIQSERMLVFSIHVSCGFTKIEAILNDHVGEHNQSEWFYGNVYNPEDGVTPLNWWKELLKPQ